MRLRPPAAVRAVAAGERVLAWADAPGGAVVVSRGALHLPGRERLPWERVEHATWADGVLTVTTVDAEVVVVTLDEPAGVPEAVRERVTSSLIAETHVPLQGKRGVLLVARRSEAGEVRWALRWDEGLDPGDPQLAGAAEAALAATRSAWGI